MTVPAFVEPIRTTRTFEAAIDQIVEGIERHRLRAGERLPTESELAAQLGISRPTLRQALRVLEGAGLLAVRRGKGGGIFVDSDLVPFEEISRGVALEEDAMIDVLRARRALEGAIAVVALRLADEDDLAEIERANRLMREHLGDRAAVRRANTMFHRAVVRATHNRWLQGAMWGLARDMEPIRAAYPGGLERDRESLEIHERQLAALRGRDVGELVDVLDVHFRILEEAVAGAIGKSWRELFGTLAEPRLDVSERH